MIQKKAKWRSCIGRECSHNPKVSIMFEDEQFSALNTWAEKKGLPFAAAVREAIDFWIKEAHDRPQEHA